MTKVYAIITCILHFTGRFTLGNKVKKINKRSLDSKEVKLCEFRDIIIYVKNPIESTKILLEHKSQFSQMKGYKINHQFYLCIRVTNKN